MATLLLAAAVGLVFLVLPHWVERRGQFSGDRQPPGAATSRLPEALPLTAEGGGGPAAPAPVESRAPQRSAAPDGRLAPAGDEPAPAGPAAKAVPVSDGFNAHMSAALAALAESRYEAARSELEAAGRIRPGSPVVADALARVDEGLRLERLAGHRRRAVEHERTESWAKAISEYEAALALDPNLAFARTGRRRAVERARLASLLQHHIDHPERLSTAAVLLEAETVLEEARDVTSPGPVLAAQIDALAVVVKRAATLVAVRLESDNLTDVVVYRVGRLGTFFHRTLELRPGNYTVTGTRRGFRDVRIKLSVTASGHQEPLVVRCSESL